MAITAAHILSKDQDAASSATTATLTPVASRLYLLTVRSTLGAGTPNTPTVTGGGGLTWVLVATATQTISRVSVFRALKTSGLTSGTVVVDFAGQTQVNIRLGIAEFTNAKTTGTDGSGAIVQSATNSALTGSTASATLSAFADATNNASFMGIAESANETNNAEAGWTKLYDGGTVAYEWRLGGDTSPTMSWTTSTIWEAIACEIAANRTVVAVGQTTETDTSQAVSRSKTRSFLQVTETDLAQILSAARRYAIGQTTETDTSQAFAHSKTKQIVQALETDLAQTINRVMSVTLGQAAETDSAGYIYTGRGARTLLVDLESATTLSTTTESTGTLRTQVVQNS